MASPTSWKLLLARLGLLMRGGGRSLDAPVDADDPLKGALADSELLVAYAAQSRRSIKPEKIKALIDAAAALRTTRATGNAASAADIAAFWTAYDAFALDMAPLSAHSIRSSIRVNALRLPGSLFTPTAANAAFAVLVFFACLALQGFWVAGDELIKRAEQIEAQKVEVLRRMDGNVAALNRSRAKQSVAAARVCEVAKCEPFELLNGGSLPTQPLRSSDLAALTSLVAEFRALLAEIADKEVHNEEVGRQLAQLNERGRPIAELLRDWHHRAHRVCSMDYLGFLCPGDVQDSAADALETKRKQLSLAQEQLRKTQDDYDKQRYRWPREPMAGEREPAVAQSGTTKPFDRASLQIQRREVERLEELVGRSEVDSLRSILVEARLIAANISAYLIAMVMGVLGALTYVLRTLSLQLRDHTYVPISASISIVRICLGAIAGVFGSLLVPASEFGLKSLPPLFVPFIFGYGIEILFSLLDKVVRTFTQPEGPAAPGARPA